MSNGATTQTQTTDRFNVNPNIGGPQLTGGARAAGNQFAAAGGESGLEDPNQVAGRNLIGNTLGGKFLSPETNPYLQQTFDVAADNVKRRLNSDFASAGRNTNAGAAAASDELQSLAAQLYGGNFQNERDRQVNSLGQVQTFDPLNQLIQRIGGIAPISGQGGVSTGSSETEDKASPFDRLLGGLGALGGLF